MLGLATPLPAQEGPDPVGDWAGELDVGAARLTLVFHVTRSDDGTLASTLDSPDQGAMDIPTGATTLTGDTLTIEVPGVGGRYTGTIAGDTLTGTWSQGAQSLPLVLARGGEIERPERPQDPQPPFPYRTEDVRIDNPEAEGVTLAGTLSIPEGEGPFPGVVLVSGSGPQDRDEALMGHRPFAVLADGLTRHGIAVLRYDDRGFASSTGEFAGATSRDFASDAAAAAAWLASRPDVADVGIVGHSEGGIVGPMVATEYGDRVDFLVLLAGTGLTGAEILAAQTELIMEANGAPPGTVRANREIQDVYAGVARMDLEDEAAIAEARRRILPLLDTLPASLRNTLEGGSVENRDRGIAQNVRQMNTPWFRFFLDYDPAETLRRVSDVPVLALNGSLDLQVPSEVNLTAIEEALEAAGNDDVTVTELPGLNHLFQTATSGSPMEYAKIEETMAPVVWETVAEWIRVRFPGGDGPTD
ncbi:MAG TPA: alpha/beta hydrolase [Longimicrobiales bacterium]|nr:alpha/beta hydrolase [Longimicrobiales bacterium]